MSTVHRRRPVIARTIRKFAPFIILAWVALTLLVTFAVPSLEQVGRQQAVPMSPRDAPAVEAMARMGKVFQESDSDSMAMIVLEGQQPLGDDVRPYYEGLIRELRSDPHVQHVQDLWGDRLTAAGAQSADGRAVYVQLNLAGDQGTPKSQDSVAAVREIVDRTPPPPGIDIYVTGSAALVGDMTHSGESSILRLTLVGALIIFAVLLVVYRSIATVILLLFTVGVEVFAARGIVAFIGHIDLVLLSTFSINMLVALAMAAGTDYGIFFFGRYQEERQAGQDRETAFYTTYRGVAPVVLGSGLTIAGALLCLSFTRMSIFQTVGVPCAVGMVVAVGIALTLVPAVLTVGSGFGLCDPKRRIGTRRWRRVGTAIVRWPGPILVATLAITLVGLIALPGYQTSYDDRKYVPGDVPANLGYAAADRHFSQARMMPDILMIETDRDMRNPDDFLVLHRLAKAIFQVPGVSRVQGITRPEGTPIERTSIPFLISMQNAGMVQMMEHMKDRVNDMLTQAELMDKQIALAKTMYEVQQRLTEITHDSISTTKDMSLVVADLRDHIADFDDFFRPIRNYFYWEPHCMNIPVCWALRSIYDALDTVDTLTLKMQDLVTGMEKMDVLLPKLLESLPRMIEIMSQMRDMLLTMHSTMAGIFDVLNESTGDATAMGQAFDAANNDDSFYLPPEVFKNPDFQRAMGSFLSPDGKAARFIISHKGDPGAPESIANIDQIRMAAEEALKTTPLQGASIYLAGASSTFQDLRDGSKYDLYIATVSALCLIFIIMLVMTRSIIAALVIVGTVGLSLGASFGLAVLIWQYILGINLHWMVLPMAVIVLLGVGSDYNLLLVSRMKEEIAAGINTGIIRAMGGTGKVVTNAGLVFAFTMGAMVVSDLRIIGQVGTTIALGLMFDTLVVRAFLTPSIAALLGRWFWWPQVVRPRPASRMLRSVAPRPVARAFLLPKEEEDEAVTTELQPVNLKPT
ncbi:RND family transporter [Mycolicibacterium holsaticum]|uniref:MMPL/RND family transporter n=1 Tax=Mycolicibacterium holsaticum TaxID=152142 RepID=UPI001C7D9098|nr:RND family transporter [Mycolicibacterium holsaticum]MDA4110854.1 membrane protein [Mycolicibacterium holsaticum DSM 44478 = JCM 12374]QZA12198.1 RND family transporter [Mycolicibacterium holsaticum DSM 44478 = JCM 12374]UNC10316.1 RND family transporter [Mycolicibacterium holsaticum DSM 44478 = JCM 12374]